MLSESPMLPNRETKIIMHGKGSLIWTWMLPSRTAHQLIREQHPWQTACLRGGHFHDLYPALTTAHIPIQTLLQSFCLSPVLGMMKSVQGLLSKFRCSWEEQLSDGSAYYMSFPTLTDGGLRVTWQQPCHVQKTVFHSTHPHPLVLKSSPPTPFRRFPEPWRSDIDALFGAKHFLLLWLTGVCINCHINS